MIRLTGEGDTLHLAEVRPDGGVPIGEVNLCWRSQVHRRGEIGFVLHPDHQGQGYATEAVHPLLRLGLEDLGLHRIAGRADERNSTSAAVLDRLEMRQEAHLRQNETVAGEWCDEGVYAMLASESTGPIATSGSAAP